MQLKVHNVLNSLESEDKELIYVFEKDSSLFDFYKKDKFFFSSLTFNPYQMPKCGLVGTDILFHPYNTCPLCEYKRINLEQDKAGIYYLDKLEWFEFCDLYFEYGLNYVTSRIA